MNFPDMRLTKAQTTILDFLVAKYGTLIDLGQVAAHLNVPPHRARQLTQGMSKNRLIIRVSFYPKHKIGCRHIRRLRDRREFFLLDPWLVGPAGLNVWRRFYPNTRQPSGPRPMESAQCLADWLATQELARAQRSESLLQTRSTAVIDLKIPGSAPLQVQLSILRFLIHHLNDQNAFPVAAAQIAEHVRTPIGPTLRILDGLCSQRLVKRFGRQTCSLSFTVAPALFDPAGANVWRQLFGQGEEPKGRLRKTLAQCLANNPKVTDAVSDERVPAASGELFVHCEN